MRGIMQGATTRQALVTSYFGIELFWYPLNRAAVKGFSPAAWDPYADRLMVYMTQRAGGAAPAQYSARPNLLANLETALGALATQVGQQTRSQAVQVTLGPQHGDNRSHDLHMPGTRVLLWPPLPGPPACLDPHCWAFLALEAKIKLASRRSDVVTAVARAACMH
jgi:hypothetical protein